MQRIAAACPIEIAFELTHEEVSLRLNVFRYHQQQLKQAELQVARAALNGIPRNDCDELATSD